MTDRQRRVLRELQAHTDSGLKHDWHRKWARPMDVGGHNGSHHGATLARLVELGLAERDFRGGYHRMNYVYRITDAGRRAIEKASDRDER